MYPNSHRHSLKHNRFPVASDTRWGWATFVMALLLAPMLNPAKSYGTTSLSELLTQPAQSFGTFLAKATATQRHPRDCDSAINSCPQHKPRLVENGPVAKLLGTESISLNQWAESQHFSKPRTDQNEAGQTVNEILNAGKITSDKTLTRACSLSELGVCDPTTPSANAVDPTDFTIPPAAFGPGIARVEIEPLTPMEVSSSDSAAETVKMVLRLDLKQGEISSSLPHIFLSDKNQVLKVRKDSAIRVFVRDEDYLQFDEQSGELIPQSGGQTEIYAVHDSEMKIIQVQIGKDATPWDLAIPKALVSLEGGDDLRSHASLAPGANELTVHQSRVDALKTLAEHRQQSRQLTFKKLQVEYSQLTMQFMDDRSNLAKKQIFPLSGISAHVLGTEFNLTTDATGIASVAHVPKKSRLLIQVDDEHGIVVPSMFEIKEGGSPVKQLQIQRSAMFDMYQEILNITQHHDLGSICGRLSGHSITALVDTDDSGFVLALDVNADGPFYFNNYGYPDSTLEAAAKNGRFCFFNVEPGPASLTVTGDDVFAQSTLPVISGRLFQTNLDLNNRITFQTRLVAAPTSYEQLGEDSVRANSYQPIDMIDLFLFGSDNPLMQLDKGLVGLNAEIHHFSTRVFGFAQAFEFEPTVYQYDTEDVDHVTQLMPRGLVEDLAMYSQTDYDPSLGVAVIEHGGFANQSGDRISVSLFSSEGEAIIDGWYYSDRPTTKVIFFNLEPGIYGGIVADESGTWLAAETLYIYNEAVSFIRTGSGISLRP